MPGAWLILPTYNEAENIEAMLRAALAQLASSGREHTILVVDDGSPDGTGQIADAMAGEHTEIRVMHRPAKQGLGRAYLAGFEDALAGGAELILEMDSDFSHDPASRTGERCGGSSRAAAPGTPACSSACRFRT